MPKHKTKEEWIYRFKKYENNNLLLKDYFQQLILIQKQLIDIITNEIFIQSNPKHDIDSFISTSNGKR